MDGHWITARSPPSFLLLFFFFERKRQELCHSIKEERVIFTGGAGAQPRSKQLGRLNAIENSVPFYGDPPSL